MARESVKELVADSSTGTIFCPPVFDKFDVSSYLFLRNNFRPSISRPQRGGGKS